LEVGLGGRLDATNVVTPGASAIVSISLDHTTILGTTEAEIAAEKGGILKSGVPYIVGPLSEEASTAISRIADNVAAVPYPFTFERLGDEVEVETSRSRVRLRAGLPGAHQLVNAAVAYATLEAGGFLRDPEIAKAAVAQTRLVGRAEWISVSGRRLLVDGAHNPGSAPMLARVLDGLDDRQWTAIVGMLEGHDPDDFFAPELVARLDRVLAVPIDNPRALSPAQVAEAARRRCLPAQAYHCLDDALSALGEGPVVITGSYYLVGEVMRRG